MTKVSQLPQDTAPTSTDYTIALDTESGIIKKVLLSDLATLILQLTTSLTVDSTPTSDDYVVTVDGATGVTKKATLVSLNNQAWIAPTYTNGWVNYDNVYGPAGYYKDSMGNVHLRGLVKSGTVGLSAFTLPVGYRPEVQLLFACTSADAHCRVDINTNGTVLFGAGVNNIWVSINNISFRAYA